MDSRNIFLALSNYPYNPERNPRENQHTAFFAYLLNTDTKLLKYILKKLLSKKSKLLNTIKEEDFDGVLIQEPESLDKNIKIPDMKVRTIDDSLTVYIENKIDSFEGRYSNGEERESQLNKYLELAENNSSEEKFVVYITKYYEDINQETEGHKNFGGHFTWGMILDIIDEYIGLQSNSSSGKNELIKQFIEYMERSNLTGTKGFEKEYNEVWKNFIELKEIRTEYLGYLENYFETQGYSLSKENTDTYNIICVYKSKWNTKEDDGFWINIGFELDFEWETESESSIVLIAQLGCRKKFFENIERKFGEDLKKAIDSLEKLNFIKLDSYKDPVLFDGYITLKGITNGYLLSKDKQIKEITVWVQYAVDTLESSKLLKLLEKNYPHRG